ncbi:hypothetical protein J28TS4_45700 [Paenibacillus lautus]|nr:hypothetical protein HMPREF9412_1707 [Paenibacillus sp. HGF5]ETT60395.1 hypothetical protein C172_21968 [Paenibacillus sp. FSL H8-457]PCL89581.1 hypothetical protein CPZ30_27650 [Paenibacillus lautus]GIP06163.1 hypothetical protein J28TS4_45700 [Paenibacillus lautus]
MVNSCSDYSGTYEQRKTAALSFDRDKKRHFFDMKHIFQPLQMGGRYAFLLMYLFLKVPPSMLEGEIEVK